MKIAVGWDHRGRVFHEKVMRLLNSLGHEVVELGAQSPQSSDYPDFAFKVGEAVAAGLADRGLLICGTGAGMAIAANKVFGVRAGVAWDVETARLIRAHNDTNVLCLGEQAISSMDGEKIISTWLDTPFDGGRHARRVDKITRYEEQRAAPKKP